MCNKTMRNHLIATQLGFDTIRSTDQHMSSVAIACQKYKESLEKEKNVIRRRITIMRIRSLSMNLMFSSRNMNGCTSFMRT